MKTVAVSLFAAGLFLGGPAIANPAMSFDQFLGDLNRDCRPTNALEAFWRSLEKGALPGTAGGEPLVVPDEIRNTFGRANVFPKGDHNFVVIEVSGSFKGLRLARLEFALPGKKEISAMNVIFAEPFPAVYRRIGDEAKRGQAAIQKSGDRFKPILSLVDMRGTPMLQCDYSF